MPITKLLQKLQKDPENEALRREAIEALANAILAEREKVFAGIYCVDEELMKVTNPGCMVQHCLPAHREEEITTEVFEAHADEIFDEALPQKQKEWRTNWNALLTKMCVCLRKPQESPQRTSATALPLSMPGTVVGKFSKEVEEEVDCDGRCLNCDYFDGIAEDCTKGRE